MKTLYFICYLHNSSTRYRYSYVMVQYYTSSVFLTNFIRLLLLNSFPFMLFLICYKWSCLYKWKKLKTSRETCFLYMVLVFLQIVLEVRTKSQIPKIFIPIIIIIMVNLSLTNNNKAIKSLELTSNTEHRTSSKYCEHRRRKNWFLKELVEHADWYNPVLNKSVTTRK